ncbi:unnamed protein product [Mytilus coruscus]|uniref:Uncharacterized protein n=1 Tax=Mytilus coruscus TaxID=42192 RepID=A0A6J8AV53_MYTCO|nr:unnamed protein product [Mytilus coruscus]
MTTLDLNTYIQVQKKDVDQKIFLTAETSLQKIIKVVENHSSICNGHFSMKKLTPKGHVPAVRFNCDSDKHHSILWSSSPYLPNGEYLANLRTFHGYTCSGMLPVHYNRFANAAKIGHINKQKQQYMFQRYKHHIEQQYNESIESAVLEEIGMYDDLTGINIMTDARHGWRKNAKDSSVVAIGEKSTKFLNVNILQNLMILYHNAMKNWNNHQKCHPDSRCKRDTNYEPKRIVLSISIAEKLLLGVIRKPTIYTHPADYVLAKDTCYVDSFNNTMNIFQDKRIAFSDDNYQARSQLAVCHWNENVNRDFTSIWNPNRRNAPRSNIGKKNYKPPTYNYRESIWARQINSFY